MKLLKVAEAMAHNLDELRVDASAALMAADAGLPEDAYQDVLDRLAGTAVRVNGSTDHGLAALRELARKLGELTEDGL